MKMKIQKMKIQKMEGFTVTIEGGLLGTFTFTGAFEENEEDCGGHSPVISKIGKSTPIYRNGEYFLPWHISAALTANGWLHSAWIKDKSDSEVIEELLKMRHLYKSGVWHKAVTYANQLCNEFVY